MATLFKRFFLLLLLALVLVPVLQARFRFIDEKALGGAYNATPHPELTWQGLRDNTYQPALEQYIEGRLGFRTFLIRLRNQLSFSLFRVARSSDVVVGRHDVLFQSSPIAGYAGQNLLNEEDVRFRVRRLRAVQRMLGQRGVQLLFVMAPNKARFEPEELPAHLRPAPGTVTNYDLYTRAMKADTLALLDFVPVFAQWKKTKPYPLFPRAGTHWSGYGATLAADTLLRRLEQLTGLRFPVVRTTGPPQIVSIGDSLRATDYDLGEPLNLLRREETVPLAYRQLAFLPPQPGETRPSALFVGDSFIWGLMLFSPYLQREFSDDTRIWFYNISVHIPDSFYHKTGENVENLDLRQQLEARRIVVLMLTEHNLIEHEFGFIDQVYRLYHPLTAADQQAIDQLAQKLGQEATWEEQTSPGFTREVRKKAQLLYEQQEMN